MRRNRTMPLMMMVLAAALSGCQYYDEVAPNWLGGGRELDEGGGAVATAPFPADTPPGPALDIEVVPEKGRIIRLDNRTVQRYEHVSLWLNQQYAGRIDAIEIGHNEPIELDSFVNEHGERYPIARFLATDKYSPLVAADLVVDGKLHRLHVRLHDWRHP